MTYRCSDAGLSFVYITVKTVMNAAPVGLALDPAVVELSDIFCVNESEVCDIYKKNYRFLSNCIIVSVLFYNQQK